jgi:hypothetical protein
MLDILPHMSSRLKWRPSWLRGWRSSSFEEAGDTGLRKLRQSNAIRSKHHCNDRKTD